MSHLSRAALLGLAITVAAAVATPTLATAASINSDGHAASVTHAAPTGKPTLRPTSLTISAGHKSVKPRHSANLVATLKSGHTPVVGATVSLEQRSRSSKSWSAPVAIDGVTDTAGHVTIPVTPGNHEGAKVQFRVVFAGDSQYKASHSAVITVTVS